MLERQSPSEKYEMLPWFVGDYTPRTSVNNFETAKKSLKEEDYKMVENRRFERINNMIESESCIKNEDIPENKETFVYGFKHIKTDSYTLIRSKSDELNENNKIFNFWSNKFKIKRKK